MPKKRPSRGTGTHGPACNSCFTGKKKCIYDEGGICSNCRSKGLICTPRQISSLNERKRKREDTEQTMDHLPSPSNRAPSSVTASYDLDESEEARHTFRTRRSTRERTVNSSASLDPLGSDRNACGICHKYEYVDSAGKLSWVACDNCGSWFHLTCFLAHKTKKRILLATPQGMKQAIFHCQKCVLNADHFTQELSAEFTNFLDVAEQIKKHTKNPHEYLDRPISNSYNYLLQQNEALKTRCQALERENDDMKAEREELAELHIRREDTEELGPPINPQYSAYDSDEVEKLLRNLDETINDCTNDAYLRTKDSKMMPHPLAAWSTADTETDNFGQPWFTSYSGSEDPQQTSPTATLRDMLKISQGRPLEVDARLKALNFAQIYKSFVWWFVFDVFFHLGMDAFPSMKVVQAMSSAVRGFAFERWPKVVSSAVEKEVRLRAWHKPSFEQANVEEKEKLRRCMQQFLAPLTEKPRCLSVWSSDFEDIIIYTIRIWKYLQALGATGSKLTSIHPSIGDAFDPDQHEAINADTDGVPRADLVKLKVLWTVRRGFVYREDGQVGMTKAVVMVTS